MSALPEDSARAAERAFLDPQRGRTWNQMYSFAKKAQKALDRVAARIAKEVDGIEYKTPGLKDRKAAEARAAEKKKAPGEMKDIARGGFMLTDPEQAGAIIARLADEFEIIDEGWQVIATSGYFDRKLQVRDANGTVFEVQLWEPHLFDAKEFRGGHDLYNEARKLEIKDADGTRRAKQGSEAEYDRLTEAMRQLYVDAMGEAPPVWRPLLDRLQSGKAERSASGAQRANDSADMARPVVNRSMGEAENQPLSRSDQAKPAGVPSDDLPSTAGVPSQLKNDSISIESTSRPIIAEQDILSKAADEADLFSDVQYRQDLADAEDILARYDVDLPERIVVEDGAEVMELRPAREVLDGLDAEEKAIIDLHTCHRGSA